MTDDTAAPLRSAADGGRIGVVVLAAGLGSRFGGHKLSAELDGRPLLQHVLDVVRTVHPARIVVVMGPDPASLASAIEWRDEQRVENPRPSDGLSSSLRLGIRACVDALGTVDGLFVVLSDQPRLRGEVLLALAGALTDARRAGAWAVMPRYRDGLGNPVLLLPDGLAAVETLTGDRGVGPMLRAEPDRAWQVPIEGLNPDVDTPEDLERLRRGAS